MEELEKKDSKSYEVAFLLRNEEEVHEISKLLKQHSAEVTYESPLKKIALSYPIKKEIQAHFGFFHFNTSPENATAINRDLQTAPFLLRFIIINQPFIKEKAAVIPRTKERVMSPKLQPEVKSSLPLSNEALEKKIEEILQ